MFSNHSTFLVPPLSRWVLRHAAAALTAIAALTSASLGHAQDEEAGVDAADEATEEPAAEGGEAGGDVEADKPAREVISSPPDSKDRGSGIWEDPKKTYYFAGMRYRMQVVPKAVQNWFAEGGETLWVNTPGLEFAIRQDGFEYNIFGMLGLYSMKDVPFKGNTDVELAWETITADYQVLFLGSDFMWSTSDFTPGLSFTYGAGVGLGLVFGQMTRTQAYPETPGSSNYLPCTSVGNPNFAYCDNINDHYNGKVEPNWLNDGSSPVIFPWIAGQIGLRYKAHKHFVARLDAGYAITSVFFGLGADYGL